jgi:hypothetical protein
VPHFAGHRCRSGLSSAHSRAQAGIIPKISKPRFHEKSIDRAEPLDARTVRRANASSRVIAARRQGSQKDRALLYRIAKADAAAA